jgi:signal transduction histidine kinase
MEASGIVGRSGIIRQPYMIEGNTQEITRVIEDPKESLTLYQHLAASVKSEALLLLPSSLELVRAHKLGIIDKLVEASEKRGATVRILCPVDESNNSLIKSIQSASKRVTVLSFQKYNFRSIFFIVDSNEFIRAELKNPDAQQFEYAVGLSVYSSSKPSVDSFKTFFDVLWDQMSLNEDFRKRDKLKDEFIAVASHELRTPIQPIIGYAFLAKKGKVSQEEAWDAVLKEARRLQQLANDILDVSKMDSGNIVYFMDNDKINSLLVSIADSVKNVLPPNVSISVEFDEAETDLEIWIDRSRITQLISNLLNNAMKFTERGRIRILSKALHNENKIEINVIDTGRGISDEMMPMLFQKFATRGHGNVQNNKGTGLGLYLCKAIVHGHNGDISAFNNSEGGATFVITLPISIRK